MAGLVSENCAGSVAEIKVKVCILSRLVTDTLNCRKEDP